MLKLNNKQAQQGFTIIELVVVILLLGILTATALPRFLDVTDEARAAVREATAGGLTTGAALYRAQWFAEGAISGTSPQGGAAEWAVLPTDGNGYPLATTDGECANVYAGLLQAGAAAVSSATISGTTDCVYVLADSVGTVFYQIATGEAL